MKSNNSNFHNEQISISRTSIPKIGSKLHRLCSRPNVVLRHMQNQDISQMANTSHSLNSNEIYRSETLDWPNSSIKPGVAALFLRDDLLRTTGQHIWGLTFTIFPDGKFKVEYGYNKPEGYEETDEIITGNEINASLAQLTDQGKKPELNYPACREQGQLGSSHQHRHQRASQGSQRRPVTEQDGSQHLSARVCGSQRVCRR